MKYCSECANPLVLLKFGKQGNESGNLMGCEKCKAVFMCLTELNLPIGNNPAWKKHMFTLDEVRKSMEENRPYLW